MTEPKPPRVSPLLNPSAAETVSMLAAAMGHRRADARKRQHAGAFPPSPEERAALVALYAQVEDAQVRQALLDVLTAVVASGGGR